MSDLAKHLGLLTSSGAESHGSERQLLEEWARYQEHNRPSTSSDGEDDGVEDAEPWASVLDVYRQGDASATIQDASSSILSKLINKPNIEPLLPTVQSALSSTRENEVVYGELLELIGYEDMEFVMEIMENRASVVQELTAYSAGGQTHSGTLPPTSTRKGKGKQHEDHGVKVLTHAQARKQMEKQFRENAARPLFTGTAQAAAEVLPHVYTSSSIVQGAVLSQFGSKYMLPLGTTRVDHEEYEEVVIPPAKAVPPRASEKLVLVSELDPIAKGSFPGYESLNRIQSIVYPTAYRSNENMLICAPTGAGKTDVAMLSILRVIDQHRSEPRANVPLRATIHRDAFKVIYVAPMKALASEITRKLGKRLQWLGIAVRELTGDMQLTKNEIAETQIIVTTPEKWDVVTRKPTGEGELASKLKLLIIDEVHLLNEERGAVIETIVARTLRQVESSQSVIRIVGLSATLPNYIDVADFLSVSRYHGLFYFDSSFRPVPLEQHFLGIRGKPGSMQSRKNLDRVAFEKVEELVRQGHQIMVFVHARKETVKTALGLKETALTEGSLDDFSCEEHPQWSFFRKQIGESRNKEMKQLFDNGFGIHHAGMLRSDRNMMERMFEARAIKVLCCTATLAWGVNLPAHAVIIKGTQVYDSSKGSFVDLSVLDVLQVFGRAGRPGLETSGEGYILTTEDKLTHYLDAVTSQNPIESQFVKGMIDSLNAEIALGTVANTHEAVRWLGYTYLFVRMRRNPFQYGIPRDAHLEDPQLGNKRNELVTMAARKLADARMIVHDQSSGALTITDLGRIAAKYYIRYLSIEIFNEEFKPKMTEGDVLRMLSMSTEFDQLQVRETEVQELKGLLEIIPCKVQDKTDTSQGKVNILLQSYISRQTLEDFALVSDMAYAAQNGGRIVRALMEIAVSRKWANVTAVLMGISKAIEKRLWPYDQPLRQFDLKADVIYNLERWGNDYLVSELAELTAAQLGELVRMNERHGDAILNAAKQFPNVHITCNLRPLGPDVLKLAITVTRAFTWSTKVHGSSEPFWIWVEDHDGVAILQLSHLLFRQNTDVLEVDFVISIPEGKPPPSVTIWFVSDRWMGAESEVNISLESLVMPVPSNSHTPRLDLPFLSLSVLQNPVLEHIFARRLQNFNAIQTQIIWSLLNTRLNALVCAPTGSGKSLIGHILICTTIMRAPSDACVLVVAPQKSAAASMLATLRQICKPLSVLVESVRGNALAVQKGKVVKVVTASQLLHSMTHWNPKVPLLGLTLVICEDLEQLNPAYELGVSLLRHATQSFPTRYVGFSTSLNEPADLAAWLDVDPLGLHSFRPSDRDQSLAVSSQVFTIPQSAALFKAMVKPAYTAVRAVTEGAVIFVPSRGQIRSIAQDLLTQCALNMETERGFLSADIPADHVEEYLVRLRDKSLIDFVSRGVGFFHDGISKPDRNLMLELYIEGIIRVLVVPRESCWELPIRAACVVVMGTQYVDLEAEGADRKVCEYDLAELVRMQSRAVRHSSSGNFHVFCQAEVKDTIMRFLTEGLPLESQLLETGELETWHYTQVTSGAIRGAQQAVDALSFTFLARRVVSNPTYYDADAGSRDESLSRMADVLGVDAQAERLLI
ncbi:Sec63-domain-containing protein [Athelia psychrophila]|uniref:Sec63-domain-containing protein n=1 Tax=Athelia psychrophila TaxID=1759441 RepID=A0A166AZ31_9AGAM|nr:Sec63-domain-containing protein [Fibularhizoctonia sp. CBS 109695]